MSFDVISWSKLEKLKNFISEDLLNKAKRIITNLSDINTELDSVVKQNSLNSIKNKINQLMNKNEAINMSNFKELILPITNIEIPNGHTTLYFGENKEFVEDWDDLKSHFISLNIIGFYDSEHHYHSNIQELGPIDFGDIISVIDIDYGGNGECFLKFKMDITIPQISEKIEKSVTSNSVILDISPNSFIVYEI